MYFFKPFIATKECIIHFLSYFLALITFTQENLCLKFLLVIKLAKVGQPCTVEGKRTVPR